MRTSRSYSTTPGGPARPRPRKVVMISNHGCMRVHKTAIVLINAGYDVHLIVNKISQFSEVYQTVQVYQNANQMRASIAAHADADLFHAHNEPSWFVTAIKETLPKAKVVLDVHDSMLLRRTEAEVAKAKHPAVFRHSTDERNNLQLADGLVYPCAPMQRIVGSEYALRHPHCVVPSALPRQMQRFDVFKYISGLCYEGRIDLAEQLDRQWDFFNYCNYLPMAESCAKAGIPFFIYTSRKDAKVRAAYGQWCHVNEPLPYDTMLKTIGGHDWGLVGNLKPYTEWKHALPNKLFEYWGASMPVVCMHADETWRFIKDTGMGIKVDSLDELKARWGEQRRCREQVVKRRKDFALERWLPDLERVYTQVLDGERPAPAIRPAVAQAVNGNGHLTHATPEIPA